MRKLIFKKTLLSLMIGLGLALPLAPATVAALSAKEAACQGVALGGGPGDCDPNNPANENSINGTISTVLELISVVVGVIAVIMIIVSGLKYITSAGDSSKISSAKDALLYALIGLAVVAIAQTLVRFVIRKLPG